MRVAFVSRELHPYIGGGIAPIVAAAARQLSEHAEVTVFTTVRSRRTDAHLRAEQDQRLLPDDVQIVWVPEQDTPVGDAAFSHMHAYSANVFHALKQHYGADPPDLVEFCDYLAEGFVTVQAVHTCDPWLERTTVAVRTHTTSWVAQVLDGHVAQDAASRASYDMEGYALQHADVVLWPGGDVHATYERIYGRERLAPAVELPDAFLVEGITETGLAPLPEDDVLRVLFLGRSERRKGIANLVRAVRSLERRDVHLTVLGGDTDTGPLRGSLRGQLELMAEGDDRITFLDAVPRHEVGKVIEQHHVVAIPSLWECWPNVGREALMHNRPVLATAVGGLRAMAVPGTSGFLAQDTSPEGLRRALLALLEDVSQVRALVQAGGPRKVFEELTDLRVFTEGYASVARSGPRRASRPAGVRPPLVSVVIPYFKLEAHVTQTVESVLAQTHPAVEVVLVNDGCFRPEDAVLDELVERHGVRVVSTPNSGLSTARNHGIAAARGRYVLPLDADDLLHPEALARFTDALERRPELAYVTSWVEYMREDGRPVPRHPGYRPLGNWSRLLARTNVAGSATALFRRSLFDDFGYHPDLTSYEDWYLYQELDAEGLHGAVVPDYLIRYRVRADSMTRSTAMVNRDVLMGEMAAHLEERKITWQP